MKKFRKVISLICAFAMILTVCTLAVSAETVEVTMNNNGTVTTVQMTVGDPLPNPGINAYGEKFMGWYTDCVNWSGEPVTTATTGALKVFARYPTTVINYNQLDTDYVNTSIMRSNGITASVTDGKFSAVWDGSAANLGFKVPAYDSKDTANACYKFTPGTTYDVRFIGVSGIVSQVELAPVTPASVCGEEIKGWPYLGAMQSWRGGVLTDYVFGMNTSDKTTLCDAAYSAMIVRHASAVTTTFQLDAIAITDKSVDSSYFPASDNGYILDANGGTVNGVPIDMASEVDSEIGLVALPKPVREGYVFTGWYTNAGIAKETAGDEQYTPAKIGKLYYEYADDPDNLGHINLTARWAKIGVIEGTTLEGNQVYSDSTQTGAQGKNVIRDGESFKTNWSSGNFACGIYKDGKIITLIPGVTYKVTAKVTGSSGFFASRTTLNGTWQSSYNLNSSGEITQTMATIEDDHYALTFTVPNYFDSTNNRYTNHAYPGLIVGAYPEVGTVSDIKVEILGATNPYAAVAVGANATIDYVAKKVTIIPPAGKVIKLNSVEIGEVEYTPETQITGLEDDIVKSYECTLTDVASNTFVRAKFIDEEYAQIGWTSVREPSTDVTTGLRFRGRLSKSVANSATSIGFIMCLSDHCTDPDLVLDSENTLVCSKKVAGVYAETDSYNDYQLCIKDLLASERTNENATKDFRTKKIKVVMYVTTAEGTFYSAAVDARYNDLIAE